MRVQQLRARDFTRRPWKNGGGTTTELAIHREGARWLWRVSVADVTQSGPFSDFPGYERTLVMLEGDGMELMFDTMMVAVVDRVHEPIVFDGGARTDCRLIGGAVRDLNLMVDRERARGSVAVVAVPGSTRYAPVADWSLIFCLRGAVTLEAAAQRHTLERGDLLRLDGPLPRDALLHGLTSESLVADIRITRRDPPPPPP